MPTNKENPAAHSPLPTDRSGSGRPTWAEIDLDALLRNYRMLSSLLLPSKPGEPAGESLVTRHSSFVTPRLIPVVKADAYGHGSIPVAKALAAAGATAFAVALVEEGAGLRAAGISQEILVLEGAWPGEDEELIRHRLTAAIHSIDGILRLDDAARRAGGIVPVHIKVDTGMARLGVSWDRMEPFLQVLRNAAHLRLAGTCSHLASAEEGEPAYSEEQIRRFQQAISQVRRWGLDPGEVHLANSAGLLYFPQLRGMSARPGIALYGYPPARDRCALIFQPVLTLKTRVGRIHTIPAGESVGYNRRFVAARTTRTATLPIGYADGFRRDLTSRGHVLIRDQKAEIIGAVSMDMAVVDVTDLPDVQEWEEVILLGTTDHCRLDAVEWASRLGTIPYEVLCALGPRIPRIYRAQKILT